ncbi:MAG TPA: hypothetical protein VF213_06075, partial [Dongiaceae bacterium]
MDAVLMSMPGVVRLRSLYPLTEEDGSCPLVYDVERSAVLEVPEELQLHFAQALETGDPDEDMLGWMMSEDLLTNELPAGGGAGGAAAPETLEERSPAWLAEVEAALHLYHRARLGAPAPFLRAFEGPARLRTGGCDFGFLGLGKP